MECRIENQFTMLTNEKSLKPIPCGLTKSKIYELFNHLSRARVQKTMHWVQIELEENPNVTQKEIKRRRDLSKPEVKRLFYLLGSPKGYQEVEE